GGLRHVHGAARGVRHLLQLDAGLSGARRAGAAAGGGGRAGAHRGVGTCRRGDRWPVNGNSRDTGIAVVGMACRYPGACSPAELWDNVLACRREFRRVPAERLRLEDYLADPQHPDSIYSTEAALIEGWEFDRVRFNVSGTMFRSADLAHWLALEVAA